uniref:Uncharacterized protein n=1 Tax=Anguilla anguilla TaxID=7936 RepID=A0A0E9QNB9_ANGAN
MTFTPPVAAEDVLARTHSHTRTHTDMRTDTHTHTHTPAFSELWI